MITRVEVKNYKCLADVAVDLTPLHAVVGPNDSGKTSFLEAVVALVNARTQSRQAFPPGWDGRELVWHGSGGHSVTFRTTVTHPNETSGIKFTQKIDFPPAGQSISSQPLLFEPDNEKARATRESLGPALRFRFDPAELARPAGMDAKRPISLDSSGHGLTMLLDDILSDNRDLFIALEAEFCQLFPRYTRLKLTRASASYKVSLDDGRVDYVNVPGKLLWLVEKDGGFPVRAAQASDGTLIVLALLALKYLPSPPSVILIEEPENGIHPQRLEDVVRIMRDVVSEAANGNGPQVILASHSPYLLDHLEPEEVTVFSRDDEGATQTLGMSQSARVRHLLKHFHLGEVWTHEGEEKLMAMAAEEKSEAQTS